MVHSWMLCCTSRVLICVNPDLPFYVESPTQTCNVIANHSANHDTWYSSETLTTCFWVWKRANLSLLNDNKLSTTCCLAILRQKLLLPGAQWLHCLRQLSYCAAGNWQQWLHYHCLVTMQSLCLVGDWWNKSFTVMSRKKNH